MTISAILSQTREDLYLEFAGINALILAKTLGTHNPSRRSRVTALAENIPKTSIGADIGSHHDLVTMTFRLRLKIHKNLNLKRVKYDIEKVKSPDIAVQFNAVIGGNFYKLRDLRN